MIWQGLKTKIVTVEYVVSSAHFKKGFEDKKHNRPFDDSYRNSNDQWLYERGRLFACVYDGPIENGRYINSDAVRAYKKAQVASEIL